jgi:hypothetical protein
MGAGQDRGRAVAPTMPYRNAMSACSWIASRVIALDGTAGWPVCEQSPHYSQDQPAHRRSRRRQRNRGALAPGTGAHHLPDGRSDLEAAGRQTRTRHHQSRPPLTLAVPRRTTRPPRSATHLGQRLKDLGVQPGPARSTALLQLATELPAALLAACSASTSTSPSPGSTPPPGTG